MFSTIVDYRSQQTEDREAAKMVRRVDLKKKKTLSTTASYHRVVTLLPIGLGKDRFGPNLLLHSQMLKQPGFRIYVKL